MKNSDPLQRLFRSAAAAAKESPGLLPSSLENRTVCRWREGANRGEFEELASLFRRAVACATCIMVLSMGWGWRQSYANNPGTTALVNYAINVQLTP